MALIKEDGSIVSGANTLVERAEYIAYALSLGVVVESNDAADVHLLHAMDFISSHEPRMIGSRVSRDQNLPYPRKNLTVEGWSWANDEIPRQAILCQLAFAMEARTGIDLYNPPAAKNTAKKRVRIEGAIDVSYAVGDQQNRLGRRSKGMALLCVLLENSGLYSIPLVKA